MLELKRCLGDRVGNELARLFHIEMKDVVRRGLDVIARLPAPGIADCECYNSRVLLDIRNELLQHVYGKVNQDVVENVMNFVILLYDSDEAWRRMIYQAIVMVKEAEFKAEGEPRSEYWREKSYG